MLLYLNGKLPFLEFYLDQNLYHCVVPVSKQKQSKSWPAFYILLCPCINADVFQGKLHDIVTLSMSVGNISYHDLCKMIECILSCHNSYTCVLLSEL
jgi:hypothetical protein